MARPAPTAPAAPAGIPIDEWVRQEIGSDTQLHQADSTTLLNIYNSLTRIETQSNVQKLQTQRVYNEMAGRAKRWPGEDFYVPPPPQIMAQGKPILVSDRSPSAASTGANKMMNAPGQTSPSERAIDFSKPVSTSNATALGGQFAGLQPDFAFRLNQMIQASHGALYITSGYRDVALQTKLFDDAVKKYGSPQAASKWVAPPGHSNHNRGLAADLGGDMAVAHQLAPMFGLYFPMSWENWHVEPLSTSDPTHPGNDPLAYTTSPFGDVNPTQQDRTQDPAYQAASLTNAITGDQSTNGASLMGDASQGGGDLPSVDFSTKPGASPTGPTSFAGSASGGSVDPKTLYQQLKAQGLDPIHAAALVAIAGRESGYRADAHNGNASTGDNSYGLFQINLLGGMHSQFSPEMLSTAGGSVQAAASLVKSGGLQPWGGYKGAAWSQGTNLQAASDATGGEVTVGQLQGLAN